MCMQKKNLNKPFFETCTWVVSFIGTYFYAFICDLSCFEVFQLPLYWGGHFVQSCFQSPIDLLYFSLYRIYIIHMCDTYIYIKIAFNTAMNF